MSIETRNLWVIHAADNAPFARENIIALEGAELGDLSGLPAEKDAFRARYDAVYPDRSPVIRSTGANLAFRLVHEMQIGDYILFPYGACAILGTITGEYDFDGAASSWEQRRSVEWKHELPLSGFSRAALREVNASPLPLFAMKRYTGEFFSAWGIPYLDTPETSGHIRQYHPADASNPEDMARTANEIKPETAVLVPAWNPENGAIRPCTLEELNRAFQNARDFPEFLANVLQTMGYQVSAAPAGYAVGR